MPPRGAGSPYKNGTRDWGDCRSYADVGGDREPLIDTAEKLATKDPARARELYGARREELKSKRSGGSVDAKSVLPLEYVATHFIPSLEQTVRNKRGQSGGQGLKAKDVDAIKKSRHALTTCLTRPAGTAMQSHR